MYIIESDFKTRISTDLLEKILNELNTEQEDILADVSKVAEDTIASYAGVLYLITPEFALQGAARNHLVKTWALNIATYEVYQRIDDEQVPEKVIKNYDDTIEDLQKLSMGKFPLALPRKPNDGEGGGDETAGTDGTGLRRVGSQKKRSHQP